MKHSSIDTTCVHAGHAKNEHNAHLLPIYQSSTYLLETAQEAENAFSGKSDKYLYARFATPNYKECEQKVSVLEAFGTSVEADAILHSSGMAAIATLVLHVLKSGDALLTQTNLYGGTTAFFDEVLSGIGVNVIKLDFADLNQVESSLKSHSNIKMIYMETPDNPLSRCYDIEEVCKLAKRYQVLTAIDNTVATPILQRPFGSGMDFIIHSATKYLNGHGTHTAGFLVGKKSEMMGMMRKKTFKLLGGNSSSIDAFMLNNGMKTLQLRMEKHSANATKVADYLTKHPKVEAVHYCFLPEHIDYQVAKKQMSMGSACFSFEVKGGKSQAFQFLDSLQLCTHAVSLGNLDTLICHPGTTTHRVVSEAQRKQSGITDNLIRISVGIEDAQDIINDIGQALDQMK